MNNLNSISKPLNIYLLPGEIVAVNEPAEIKTILGSCICVILYEEGSCCSGMLHYLLPFPYGDNDDANNGRYANFAIPALHKHLVSIGAKKLMAKVYGGGNVLDSVQIGNGVGKENIAIALSLLQELNVPIVEKNIGGNRIRKISYYSDNHEVLHEFAGKEFSTLVNRNRK